MTEAVAAAPPPPPPQGGAPRRNAEELERRVAERTEELNPPHEALIRAKAEADEANASKTRFLAAASHDILQPLKRRAPLRHLAGGSATGGPGGRDAGGERRRLARRSRREILTALLDISRLDPPGR